MNKKMQAKGQVFSYSRSLISTMERKLDKENCPSQNTVMTVMDQSHEWMLKLVREGTMGNWILAYPQVFFYENLQEKVVTSPLGYGRDPLN